MRHELRHGWHTVSLLKDHLVFSQKYRGKVLAGKVAEMAEEIIRKTCKEIDIEVIDIAAGVNHVHLFIKPLLQAKSVYGKTLRSRWDMDGRWWRGTYRGRRVIVTKKWIVSKVGA